MMNSNCWWWEPGYFSGYLEGRIDKIKRSSKDVREGETPLEILKRWYSWGEIDDEEFARRKKDLESLNKKMEL
jgi:uncharacterized membrane protein